MVQKTDRSYDIVLFGATGFTGGLVAEYFARHVPVSSLRWALAGRSRSRLEAVRTRLAAIEPGCSSLELLEASSDDPASLARLAGQTRVVVTTVGPYVEHGEPLVRACVEAGTDYLDITGEPAFVSAMIERYDAPARASGALIVHCCGFDSIPADLGTLFTVKQLPGEGPRRVRSYVHVKGRPSGGTWASLINALAEGRKGIAPRGALADGGSVPRTGSRLPRKVHLERRVGALAVPMPVIDPQVVKRSAKLRGDYGSGFQYAQFLTLKRWPQVLTLAAGVSMLYLLSQLAPTRSWLQSRIKSGEGPDEATRSRSFFRVTFIGETDGRQVVTRVSGGDPGYTETSRMLAESALIMARDRDQLSLKGGVATPAAALGERLIERLQQIGIQFEVLESSGSSAPD